MISDTLNWHDYGGYKEMTASSSNVNFTDEDESNRIIMHKTLLQSCSTDEEESKQSTANKNLSQNYSADVEKLCSTEMDIPEYTITEQKGA